MLLWILILKFTSYLCHRENFLLCWEKNCTALLNYGSCYIENSTDCFNLAQNFISNFKFDFFIETYVWRAQRDISYKKYLGINITWSLNQDFNDSSFYIGLTNIYGDLFYSKHAQCKKFIISDYSKEIFFYDCFYMLPNINNDLIYLLLLKKGLHQKYIYAIVPNIQHLDPLNKPLLWKPSVFFDIYSIYKHKPPNIVDDFDTIIELTFQRPNSQIKNMYPQCFKQINVILWFAKLLNSKNVIQENLIPFSFDPIQYILPLRLDELNMDKRMNINYGLSDILDSFRLETFFHGQDIYLDNISDFNQLRSGNLNDGGNRHINIERMLNNIFSTNKTTWWIFVSASSSHSEMYEFDENFPNFTWKLWLESVSNRTDFPALATTPFLNLTKILSKHSFLSQNSTHICNLFQLTNSSQTFTRNDFEKEFTEQIRSACYGTKVRSKSSNWNIFLLQQYFASLRNYRKNLKKTSLHGQFTAFTAFVQNFKWIKILFITIIVSTALMATLILFIRFMYGQYYLHQNYLLRIKLLKDQLSPANPSRLIGKPLIRKTPSMLFVYSRNDGYHFTQLVELLACLVQTIYSVVIKIDTWSLAVNLENPVIWLEEQMSSCDMIIIAYKNSLKPPKLCAKSNTIEFCAVREKPWIDLMSPCLHLFLNEYALDAKTFKRYAAKTIFLTFPSSHPITVNQGFAPTGSFLSTLSLPKVNTKPNKLLLMKYLKNDTNDITEIDRRSQKFRKLKRMEPKIELLKRLTDSSLHLQIKSVRVYGQEKLSNFKFLHLKHLAYLESNKAVRCVTIPSHLVPLFKILDEVFVVPRPCLITNPNAFYRYVSQITGFYFQTFEAVYRCLPRSTTERDYSCNNTLWAGGGESDKLLEYLSLLPSKQKCKNSTNQRDSDTIELNHDCISSVDDYTDFCPSIEALKGLSEAHKSDSLSERIVNDNLVIGDYDVEDDDVPTRFEAMKGPYNIT